LLNTITDDKLEWFDAITDEKLQWIQIDCGGWHTAALTKNGEVFTWGNNGNGKLGHGDKNERTIPTKVASLDGLFIIQISCGDRHTAALTDKGEILTWYVQSFNHETDSYINLGRIH
jgi:alpha-tubulin suppressor-like RCC1 family protein